MFKYLLRVVLVVNFQGVQASDDSSCMTPRTLAVNAQIANVKDAYAAGIISKVDDALRLMRDIRTKDALSRHKDGGVGHCAVCSLSLKVHFGGEKHGEKWCQKNRELGAIYMRGESLTPTSRSAAVRKIEAEMHRLSGGICSN